MAHGVLQFPESVASSPGRDDSFIAAVADEFPNILVRQILPPEAPPTTPHLTLASISSQLALSSLRADFEVRFYGEYLEDISRGLGYVERKMGAILRGLQSVDLAPSTVGLIATLNFSLKDREEEPTSHLLKQHLEGIDVDSDDVQDAVARVAVRVRDTYYVTLTLSNYETRVWQSPLMTPGMGPIRIRPWDGVLEDVGLELAIDINNNLEARVSDSEPVVTEAGINAVARILEDIATSTGPEFAESGRLSVEQLTASSQL